MTGVILNQWFTHNMFLMNNGYSLTFIADSLTDTQLSYICQNVSMSNKFGDRLKFILNVSHCCIHVEAACCIGKEIKVLLSQ